MNAIVLALIGVGGTLAGALVSALVSSMNVRSTAEHDRRVRLWDRRVDLYVALSAYVLNRRMERASATSTVKFEPDPWDQSRAGYVAPVWLELRGRVEALASHQVLAAWEVAHQAHAAVSNTIATREVAQPGAASVAAFRQVDSARRAADQADDHLFAVIRCEMEPDPSGRLTKTSSARRAWITQWGRRPQR